MGEGSGYRVQGPRPDNIWDNMAVAHPAFIGPGVSEGTVQGAGSKAGQYGCSSPSIYPGPGLSEPNCFPYP